MKSIEAEFRNVYSLCKRDFPITSIIPTLVIIRHVGSNLWSIWNVQRVFSAGRWSSWSSITCTIPEKFSFRPSARATAILGLRGGQWHLFPAAIIHKAFSNSAKSSLKLRLAIQFGPPVNHLKNRFLIGTLSNEQNVLPYRAAFPASGFSRISRPSVYPLIDFRAIRSTLLDDQ